jgi:hypothetical protein
MGPLSTAAFNDGSALDFERRTFWAPRCTNLLGLTVPAAVDSPKKLFRLLAGLLMARRPADDTGLAG